VTVGTGEGGGRAIRENWGGGKGAEKEDRMGVSYAVWLTQGLGVRVV